MHSARARWQLGSLSHCINAEANGYIAIPDFPDEPPDPTVRNVKVCNHLIFYVLKNYYLFIFFFRMIPFLVDQNQLIKRKNHFLIVVMVRLHCHMMYHMIAIWCLYLQNLKVMSFILQFLEVKKVEQRLNLKLVSRYGN